MDGKRENVLRFFRQSAWMGVATVLGGLFMVGAQSVVSHSGGPENSGVFNTLLSAWELWVIPTIGLQAVFSQFATSSEAVGHREVLAGAVRGAVKINLLVWVVFAVGALVFHDAVEAYFKIPGLKALAVSILVPLVFSMISVFNGVLQGDQDFQWMGNIAIFGGMFRLALVAGLIFLLGARSMSAPLGVFFAYVVVLGVTGWRTRSIWREKAAPFDWRPFLRRIVFLTIGLGTSTVLFALDVPTVQRFYSETDSGVYAGSAVVARVLIRLTAPMIVVMFPKVARSALLGKKSNELVMTFGLTAVAGVGLVVFLFIPGVPEFLIRILHGERFAGGAALAPWYSACQLPLTLANVLLYSLLARERYVAVPVLALIAVGYALALQFFHQSMHEVITVMGLAGLVLLATTIFFTWVAPGQPVTSGPGDRPQ